MHATRHALRQVAALQSVSPITVQLAFVMLEPDLPHPSCIHAPELVFAEGSRGMPAGQAPHDHDRKDLGASLRQCEAHAWREHLDRRGQAAHTRCVWAPHLWHL